MLQLWHMQLWPTVGHGPCQTSSGKFGPNNARFATNEAEVMVTRAPLGEEERALGQTNSQAIRWSAQKHTVIALSLGLAIFSWVVREFRCVARKRCCGPEFFSGSNVDRFIGGVLGPGRLNVECLANDAQPLQTRNVGQKWLGCRLAPARA